MRISCHSYCDESQTVTIIKRMQKAALTSHFSFMKSASRFLCLLIFVFPPILLDSKHKVLFLPNKTSSQLAAILSGHHLKIMQMTL